MMTSRAALERTEGELAVAVTASQMKKCSRCWHYVAGVGEDAEHPELCPRCRVNLFGEGEKRLIA
jgi:isoleucyl-tRNA synthetase